MDDMKVYLHSVEDGIHALFSAMNWCFILSALRALAK